MVAVIRGSISTTDATPVGATLIRRPIGRAGATVLLAVGALFGCATEPVGDGLFAGPAQNLILFTPEVLGLTFEHVELAVDTPVPHTVYGWLIPAEGALGTVLVHHGSLFNRSALFDNYSLLHDLGWKVFIYDYQGYGESRLQPSFESLLPDADAALRYVQQSSAAESERIVLFGISLGTLPTLAQAARAPAGVVGVILQGSFVPDLLPPKSFLLAGVVPLPEVLDRLPEALDPYLNIEQITLPKLFLQSPEDLTTPIAGARRLFELAVEPKEFLEITGGHALAPVIDPDYRGYVSAFLDDLLSTQPSSGAPPAGFVADPETAPDGNEG